MMHIDLSDSKLFTEPECHICGKSVPLECAKTDDDGMVVHEECYVSQIRIRENRH